MTERVVDEAMAWARKRREQIVATATAEARQWFADNGHDEIPDLEFLPPFCSVCGEYTNVEDDVFWCDICGVGWSMDGRNGTADADHPMRRGGDDD